MRKMTARFETIRFGRRDKRSVEGFRKICRFRFRSDLPQIQRFRQNPWTCFEGPFGEVIRATGPMAKVNPLIYQTEFCDWEIDKYYWKNRFYDPSPGRWLSRDPAEESGGLNLYGFVGNDPLDFIDMDGMERIELWIAAFISPSEIRFPYYSNPNAFWHGDDRGFNPGTRPHVVPRLALGCRGN